MRRLLAQELKLMRGEVDHQQSAAGGEQASGLGDRGGGIIEKMQHLMQDHRICRAVRQRHIIQIAVAHLRVAEPGAFKLHARIGQHRVIEIETECAVGSAGEQFKDTAGAGAEIDKELDGERSARDGVAPRIGEQLRTLYDQVRSRQGGIGAAALVGNTCQGCRVSISPVELAAIRKLPPEEIKRCENCRRILVVG